MNTLIHHHFQPKISSISRRYVFSSLALIQDASILPHQHVENSTTFNPFHQLNKHSQSTNFTLPETKITHTHLLKTGIFDSDVFAANTLVDGYFKCGNFEYAARLFEKIPKPNIFSWNLMLSGCNKNLLFDESWRFFCRMHFSGIDMNQYTYGSLLSACEAMESVVCGELVYGLVMKNGFFLNGYVRAGMIDLFVKTGRFKDALMVFYDDEKCDNVVCWNAVISGAVKNKENLLTLYMFERMCRGFLMPNGFTFSSVLTACAALEELELGKAVQAWVIKCGVGEDVFVGTAILDLYAKCGAMNEAIKQFSKMPNRNVVSWTAIISGFVQKGDSISAVQFFDEMRKLGEDINNYTVTSVLTACTNPAMLKEASQLHCWLIKVGFYADPAVKSSLINMYSKMGVTDLSERVFSETENLKHLGPWATMIAASGQNGCSQRAIHLFQRMFFEGVRPDKFCCSSVLSTVDTLNLGRQIHGYTLKTGLVFDVSVGSSLFTMYSKCGNIKESYEVFDELDYKDSVSWASMIAGCVEHGYSSEAIQLFREVLVQETLPDEITLTAVVSASSALNSLKTGTEVHGFAIRHGMGNEAILGGALVYMYSKCGKLDIARRVFDMMPLKDNVSCSSLVSGYAQSGYVEEAIQLFKEILMADLDIDAFIVSSIVGAVGLMNWPSIGTQIHAQTIKMGLESEASVGSSLVTMSSKCGSIDDCYKVFGKISKPDLISWTAMIASFAEHGKGAEALEAYELMRKSGTKPDSVTFIAVLSACSHAGLVEKGYSYLNSMMTDYGIEPGSRHYACMVDLLGRSGRLREAERFVNDMPIKPDAMVWGTLLAACKLHGDVELGRVAAEKVMELEPSEAGAYVSLSNICADMGQWEQVVSIRSELKGTGAMKEPGWSSL